MRNGTTTPTEALVWVPVQRRRQLRTPPQPLTASRSPSRAAVTGRHRPSPADGRSATQRPTQRCTRGVGKLGGSTRGAEHDSISVLSIGALLLPDGVRAGDEVRLMLRREARRGRAS